MLGDALRIRETFCPAVYWSPNEPYRWKNKSPKKPVDLRIYEAHGNHCQKNYAHDLTCLFCSRNIWPRRTRSYVQGVHQEHVAAYSGPWLQLYPVDGCHGACLLCELWLSSHEFLCRFQSIWYELGVQHLYSYIFFKEPRKNSRNWSILRMEWESPFCWTWYIRMLARTCWMV